MKLIKIDISTVNASLTSRIALTVLFLVMNTNSALSQSRRDVWRMGYWQSGPPFIINFYGGTMQIDSLPSNNIMSMYIQDAGICDTNGNILFYSNGIYISNSLHDTLLNGGELAPGPATAMWRGFGMPSINGSIALPDPGNPNQYYLFYGAVRMSDLAYDTLLMAKIDMTLDGGLGGATIKNYPLSTDDFVSGQYSACKHANGRDWWLSCHGFNNDIFYTWLITPNGISQPIQQVIGNPKMYPGQASFSPNGLKYGCYDNHYELELLDFDRCSGQFSNFLYIDVPDSTVTTGGSFSPNSKLYYLSSRNYLYQANLNSIDIASTLDTVAIWDGFTDPISNQFFFQQLAPDNKIYITGFGANHYLSVINYPDSLGIACNVTQHSIYLPGRNNGSLPNYPFYELGAEGGSLCDSLPTGVYAYNNTDDDIHVFPNPAKNKIYLKYSNEKINEIEIVNALGKTVSAKSIINNSSYIEIEVSDLTPGIYFLTIKTNQSSQTTNFIKE